MVNKQLYVNAHVFLCCLSLVEARCSCFEKCICRLIETSLTKYILMVMIPLDRKGD